MADNSPKLGAVKVPQELLTGVRDLIKNNDNPALRALNLRALVSLFLEVFKAHPLQVYQSLLDIQSGAQLTAQPAKPKPKVEKPAVEKSTGFDFGALTTATPDDMTIGGS